jgi:diguanylate cyclase (GGDEF)-like protein
MEHIDQFFRRIIDSIPQHIVVIDARGMIRYVNKGWKVFAEDNACNLKDEWVALNYLDECDKAAEMGDDFGVKAASGIRSVIRGEDAKFYLEYPCHSPSEKRWFMMSVTPFELDLVNYYVIFHQDITTRKLAEEQVARAARLDGLTRIANRRAFDEFLHEEWRRCMRLKQHISLALVDIDHFKALNDTYGHQSGDEALIKTSEVLNDFAQRPSDFSARYGGEEFALIWGDTPPDKAIMLAEKLRRAIAGLNIPNENSPTHKTMTVSIGVASIIPAREEDETELIQQADKYLYRAKNNGRNRVASEMSAE